MTPAHSLVERTRVEASQSIAITPTEAMRTYTPLPELDVVKPQHDLDARKLGRRDFRTLLEP